LKICDKRLKDQGFVSKVMKMAANLFFKRKEDFLEKLDENKFLLGVENGVIDLGEDDPEPGKKHKIILRPGVPDDYVTKSCKIPYRSYEEFIKDKDPRVEELTQFRESIFINEELRDYFEGVFASSLDGYLRTEKLYILIGGGSNGKSKYMTVLENAFGDYTTTVSSTLLTGKRPSSSSATPDLMALKGVRLVTAQEPDKTDSWNMSEVKKFTGGDTVTARPLYGEIQNFKLQSTITVACNCAPKMGNNFTQGDLRRMEYIPFETTFKEFPQKEDERKIDPYLGIKMKEWHEVTLSYMLHRYCRVREEGLKVPDRVLEENRVNERNNNFMQQWTEEFVVEDEDGVVKMKDAYTRFKIWLKDIDKDSVVPTRKDFLDYLTKYFDKKPANNKWKGYSLKNEDEDEDDGGGIY
jgi:P4 family phage/plasmid primase-like protien